MGVNIIERAQGILMKPAAEWEVIDGERDSIGDIYQNYVLWLAAIPAIALVGGLMLAGGGIYRPAMTTILTMAVVQYGLALASVYVVALIIEALAPTFHGTANREQAFKVAAYSATAGWAGGVFNLLPNIAVIGVILSFYGIYLLYLGLPRLMKVPADKAIAYTAVVVVAAIVVMAVIGMVVGAAALMATPGL